VKHLLPALERARELLADPERIVLNPLHYVEIKHDGEWVEAWTNVEDWEHMAQSRRDECRVCMWGAASLAAVECELHEEALREVLVEAAKTLNVPEDEDIWQRWEDAPSRYLTSALKHGMAIQVVDAAIERVSA